MGRGETDDFGFFITKVGVKFKDYKISFEIRNLKD